MPKKLKTRVALKTDNYENWAKAVEFVPMAGEVIVYTKDGTPDKIKIGDGSTTVINLPFFAGSHTLEVEAFASEEVPIKLVKPDGTASQVVFKAGSNITLVNNGDNKVIISANLAADYGTCSTAGYDSVKVVSCTGFALKTGAKISVLFLNEHTGFYNNLTLNVNNTGAKSIYYKKSLNIPEGCIKAGSVLDFRYNGMQWVLEGFYDFANAESLSGVEGRVTTAEGQITELDGRITNAETQITNLVSKTHPYYGTCSTIGGTVEKIVSCDGFELSTNTIITIRFDSTNTAESATLNINNTGAKKIRYRGFDVPPYIIKGASVYTFIYTSSGVYDLIGESEIDYCFTTNDSGEGIQDRHTNNAVGFVLYTGRVVRVKFSKTVTHPSPRLNVSSTGVKYMKYKSANIPPYALRANEIYTFQYDGEYWNLIGNIDIKNIGGQIVSVDSGKKGVIELYKQSTSSSVPVAIDFTKNGTAWGSLGFSSAGVLERFTVSGDNSFKIHDAKSIQAGLTSITPKAANENTPGKVTFPVAFSSKPNVFVCADSTAPSTTVKGVTAYNPTTTGVSIYLNRSNTTATTIYWLAIEC